MRIIWSPRARRNLDHQIRFIAERNPVAAIEQDATVAHAVSKLALFAEAGRKGRLDRTRELVIGNTSLIAIYRIRGDLGEIHILRILHARQKYPAE